MGADIDPLARLLAKAKATPVALAELNEAVRQVEALLPQLHAADEWRPGLPNLNR